MSVYRLTNTGGENFVTKWTNSDANRLATINKIFQNFM